MYPSYLQYFSWHSTTHSAISCATPKGPVNFLKNVLDRPDDAASSASFLSSPCLLLSNESCADPFKVFAVEHTAVQSPTLADALSCFFARFNSYPPTPDGNGRPGIPTLSPSGPPISPKGSILLSGFPST